MTTDASALVASYAYCDEVIQRQAHSFYFASRFLPPRLRRDVCALYAFYRTIDDLVDERPAHQSPAMVVEELQRWRDWLLGCRGASQPLHPVCPAFASVIERYAIPLQYVSELLDGVEGDLYPRQLQTFDELERYCYLVAGTVGLVMSYVLGIADSAALANARALGIAMQLTNVLRDLGEDLARGTIYLPAEELKQFGYSRERLQRRTVDADFVALMRMQIARARGYYREGSSGIALLARESQFPILLASRIYGGILREIEQSRYDVFSRRAHTTLPRKLWIAGRSYLGFKLLQFAS